MATMRAKTKVKVNQVNELAMGDASPEKAGVGGSIPSLATMFSTAYKALTQHFHSISFQNYGAGRFASSGMLECSGVAALSIRCCQSLGTANKGALPPCMDFALSCRGWLRYYAFGPAGG
jgi:hypothetical protein